MEKQIKAAPLHLTPTEVAERWRLSRRTVERWRAKGTGPRFLRLGGRCVYPLLEIEIFESEHLRTATPVRARSGEAG